MEIKIKVRIIYLDSLLILKLRQTKTKNWFKLNYQITKIHIPLHGLHAHNHLNVHHILHDLLHVPRDLHNLHDLNDHKQ